MNQATDLSNSPQATSQTNLTSVNSRRSKAPLYWVLAVCIAPTVAAFVAYYGFDWEANTETTNYGELILVPPTVPAMPSAQTLDGKPFGMADIGKKWTYLTVNASACDTACASLLFNTRQQRAMTGRERDRVARLWLVSDAGPISKDLIAAHPDLKIVRVDPKELTFLPVQAGQNSSTHIWMVDALGRVMMRYPPNPDPNRMKRDLSKLLYASKSWQQ